MQYANQYIRSAEAIIGLYDGTVPLAVFLKQHFAIQKKFGSRDRKCISHLCYCYYRMGHACLHLPVNKRIQIALFLCESSPGVWKDVFEASWLENWSDELSVRIQYLQSAEPSFSLNSVFPWQEALSSSIEANSFARSHFIQPLLFLRIRPGYETIVPQKLNQATIAFQSLNEHCLGLANASKIDTILAIDQEVVVQDYNSQRVGDKLPANASTVWDCCAASGGKSILVKDMLRKINLTVSDIRTSILQNLKQRFVRAGIQQYQAFVADLSSGKPCSAAKKYDLIICDVPCSGSGTWGRTPEQLYYFEKEEIDQYASLQQRIVRTAQYHLEENGYFLYITCSVFKKENEEQVSFIQQNFPLELVSTEVLKGYDQKADSLFTVLFKKRAHPAG